MTIACRYFIDLINSSIIEFERRQRRLTCVDEEAARSLIRAKEKFNFENKKEIIKIKTNEKAKEEANKYDQIWTGNYIFENEWQSFRTKKIPKFEMTTAPHTYQKSGKYKIVIKIVDILGVDTMQVMEIKVD